MKRSLLLFIPLLAILLSACSGTTVTTAAAQKSADKPSNADVSAALKRSDSQGAVTVTVFPTNLDDPGDTLDFSISLETHSVELDMDLTLLSTLTNDTGIVLKNATWDGSRGGHHVKGTLSFPAFQDGQSILDGATILDLQIIGVDAPERIFTWEITR